MTSTGYELASNTNILFNPGKGIIKQEGWTSTQWGVDDTDNNKLGGTTIKTTYGPSIMPTLQLKDNTDYFWFLLNTSNNGNYGNLTKAGDSIMTSSKPLVIQQAQIDNRNNYKAGIRIDHDNSKVETVVGATRVIVNNSSGNVEIIGKDNNSGLILSNNDVWSEASTSVTTNIATTHPTYTAQSYIGTRFSWIFRVQADIPLVIRPFMNNTILNSTSGVYLYPNSSNWISYSDRRLKKDIVYMDTILNKVLQLKPCSYSWKQNDNSTHFGFIAQDVKELFPELISEIKQDDEHYMGICMTEVVPLLTQSIKDQHDIILNQQAQIDTLQSQIQTLQTQMQSILKHLQI